MRGGDVGKKGTKRGRDGHLARQETDPSVAEVVPAPPMKRKVFEAEMKELEFELVKLQEWIRQRFRFYWIACVRVRMMRVVDHSCPILTSALAQYSCFSP